MIRRFKLTLFAGFCFVAASQFITTGAFSQDSPAEKFFKNIQALKGVPASQIAGLMDNYNKALGVSCEYCHVAGDLAKSDKPTHKLSIRDIQMTREINDKYKHSVDCMSCHQGKAKPTTTFLAKNNGPVTPQPDNPATPKTDTKTGSVKPGPVTPTPTSPASPAAEPPTKVTYPASFGKVLFPHDTHMALDCAKCHHTGENNKCDTCHLHNKKTSAVTQITFYAAAHGTKSERACTACHLQLKTGPTKCTECHKK